jgi:hypothetical protein
MLVFPSTDLIIESIADVRLQVRIFRGGKAHEFEVEMKGWERKPPQSGTLVKATESA